MNESFSSNHGPLVFIGGGNAPILESHEEIVGNAVKEIVVLPTATAFEYPQRAIEKLSSAFWKRGLVVRPVMVTTRANAEDEELASIVRSARCIYFTSGSSLHLRSVLKDSLVLHAVLSAWHSGAAIIGEAAGGTVFSDPMIDPRGGAFTVGFGFVRDIAFVPGYSGEVTAQLRRTLSLAPKGCPVAAIGGDVALVREPEGVWRKTGSGIGSIFLDGLPVGLDALAGKTVA